MDNSQYDYIQEKSVNVVFECTKGTKRENLQVTLGTKISTLANALAHRRPNWLIVCEGGFNSHTKSTYNMVVVYEDNKKLGSVSLHSRRDGQPYQIDSLRAKKGNAFGHPPCTNDLKKAIAACLKFFKPENLEEKLARAENEAGGKLSGLFYRAKGLVDISQRAIGENIEVLAGGTLDDLLSRASLLLLASEKDQVKNYREYKYNFDAAQKLHAAYHTQNKGCYVIIEGLNYHVKSGVTTELFTTDNLNPELKEAVGMLKLVPDGEHVPGVGLRLSSEAFFIIRRENA